MLKKNHFIKLEGNKYRLLEQKGSGGSGTVWKAELNGANYAIKIISSKDNNKIIRFRSEITFCKKVTHRNIVKVLVEGESGGTPCYVMPFYSKTLRDVINYEIDVNTLITFIFKICSAIKFIHKQGTIHRDIKPENILIEAKSLVLADFGIAQFKTLGLTKKGEILANRNYMAPEQKLKNNAHKIGKAADIYALGLVINECFTKQNPTGSRFKLISDNYPLLSDLDKVVENMIRQNSEERLTIDEVEAEVKFISAKYISQFQEVSLILQDEIRPKYLKSVEFNKIIKRAAEDILIGEYLFKMPLLYDLEKYNRNWHMEIGFTADDFLINLYIQENVLSLCKGKFEYESNRYGEKSWYKSLDLEKNEVHKLIYMRLANILKSYKLVNPGESLLDLSGQIFKYFSSCADYHCEELLKNIDREVTQALENLKNAPIIWIVYALRAKIKENIHYLHNGLNGLGGQYYFDFKEHIYINWDRTKSYSLNDIDEELFDKSYRENENREKLILKEFQRLWKVKCVRINTEYYSIKFSSIIQYQKFRDHALKISKPHYIFEGDVIAIFSKPTFMGNMVELKLSRIFDIPYTVAIIIGVKDIY